MTSLKQFIKLERMCKGIMSISLFHKAADLSSRPMLLLYDM